MAILKGTRVIVRGLEKSPEYNGHQGVVENDFDESQERIVVRLCNDNKILSFKLCNIQITAPKRERTLTGDDFGFRSKKNMRTSNSNLKKGDECAKNPLISTSPQSTIRLGKESGSEYSKNESNDDQSESDEDEVDEEEDVDEDIVHNSDDDYQISEEEEDSDGSGDEESESSGSGDEESEEESSEEDLEDELGQDEDKAIQLKSPSRRKIAKPTKLVMDTSSRSYSRRPVTTAQCQQSDEESSNDDESECDLQDVNYQESVEEESQEDESSSKGCNQGNPLADVSIDVEDNKARASMIADEWQKANLPNVCDVEKFVLNVDAHILRRKGKKIPYQNVPEEAAEGKTQVGKTGFKALVALVAKSRKVLTVVVTTTVDLNYKLADDLENNYFAKIENIDMRPICVSLKRPPGEGTAAHSNKIQRCMLEHGLLVVNCTKYAVEKAVDLIARFRGLCTGRIFDFVLVKDESDTMSRTVESELHMERALDQLTGKVKVGHGLRLDSPLLILNISATLLPVFLRIQREGKAFYETTFGRSDDQEYSGLQNMEPLRNTFLVDNELNQKNEFWSDKVGWLYDDAHPILKTDQRDGVLLIDAVNPRVFAPINSTDRAEKVSRAYPRFAIVVVWGCGGMKVKLPSGCEWLMDKALLEFVKSQFRTKRISRNGIACHPPSKLIISEVLSAISCKQGLSCPIAVIGYSRMLRGDSFRTSVISSADGKQSYSIVPTHMLCGLGERWSLENLIQMLGRATFIGKSILERNGHARVKVLVHWRDWDNAHAYITFQQELTERMRAEGVKNALSKVAAKYSGQSDLTDIGKRTIGPRRMELTLDVRFQRGHVGQGRQWIESVQYPWKDRQGREFKLESPLTADQHSNMTESERSIEHILYHTKNVQNIDAMVVRGLVKKVLSDGEESLIIDRNVLGEIYSRVPLIVSGKEEMKIKFETKTMEDLPYVASVPILEPCLGNDDDDSRDNAHFILSKEFREFVAKFEVQLRQQQPMCSEEELRKYFNVRG